MSVFSTQIKRKCQQILIFSSLVFCADIIAAQPNGREANLRSLVAAEQSFSRLSAEKGTREAFITFLADDGVIFNPLPANAKHVWTPRAKAPGVLTWTPVCADISEAGDLGYTTGPYEFRQAAGEKPVGHGYYMSVWRRGTDGAWKVVLDIGTRNAPLEKIPAPVFLPMTRIKARKKIDLKQELANLKAADDKLSRVLSEEKNEDKLNELVGDYLRLHRMNDFPLSEKKAALAALKTYKGKINSQTHLVDVAKSGDFGYSYGTYAAREASAARTDNKYAENGSFVRIWRWDDSGNWKLTLVVMHTSPLSKRSEQ